MNILVTGANGFIGRHLLNAVHETHTVFAVVRSPSNPKSQSIKYTVADLSRPGFEKHLPTAIDCIIHLAQSDAYRDFPSGARDMRAVNIDSTAILLDWGVKNRIQQFIYTSTANVYGKSTGVITESDPTVPESFYGASKLAAEHLVRQYEQYFRVDILRLFTVYGPGQAGALFPNLVARLRSSQTITLAGGVGLYLTPIYVEDVVSILKGLIERTEKTPKGLYNVCTKETVTLHNVVTTMESILGLKARIEVTDKSPGYFSGSPDLLWQSIGLKASTQLEEGLERVLRNCGGSRKIVK